MTNIYNTLLLDQSTGDLTVDAFGNIAMAEAPYSVAQDVASAQKTVKGEVYYNSALGVDYFGEILGKVPDLTLIAEMMEEAALSVSGVATAVTTLQETANGEVTGGTEITDTSGTPSNTSIL